MAHERSLFFGQLASKVLRHVIFELDRLVTVYDRLSLLIMRGLAVDKRHSAAGKAAEQEENTHGFALVIFAVFTLLSHFLKCCVKLT